MILKKRLILIRHAHRDHSVPSKDNGLSDKGQKQVKKLLLFSANRELENAEWYSSPKKRCMETLAPVFEKITGNPPKDLVVEPAIGEGASESSLLEFLDGWKFNGAETTVICSHGDVIPMIVKHLTGGMISIKKAGWCEIEMLGRECYLTLLVQSVD